MIRLLILSLIGALTAFPRTQDAAHDLAALAARCGSEIDWAGSWQEAAELASAEARPILLSVYHYPGFDTVDGTLSGPFMNADIVSLVNERYVPLRVGNPATLPLTDPSLYGMGRHTFGQAMLIVAPDGRVLADTVLLTDAFLRDGLELDPELHGPPAPPGGTKLQRAEAAYRRGELDAVATLLAGAESAAEHHLLATRHRRLGQGTAALERFARARAAAGSGRIEADVDIDEAVVLMRMGRVNEALARIDDFERRHQHHRRRAEARYWRGALQLARNEQPAAERSWRGLIEDHPESRWAWLAAARMTGTAWRLRRPLRVQWPERGSTDMLRPPVYARRNAVSAERDALDYLLTTQKPDGSWHCSIGALRRNADEPPDDIELAVTAICAQSLIPHRGDARIEAALERALEWTLVGEAAASAADRKSYFLDYAVWSRAYILGLIADVVATGIRDRSALASHANRLIAELGEREKSAGGWSYYVTDDMGQADARRNQSMTFTSAAVVLALLRARDTGFDLPEGLLDRGLTSIERGRTQEGWFTYHVGTHGPRPATGRVGAAGRGPVCALALFLGRAAEEIVVRQALDSFVRYRHGFAAELGKTLMHTGPQAQGSHFLMFDYAAAAAAVAALPVAHRQRFRETLLDQILRARTVEGAFMDTVLNGRAFGAGMALQAFESLRAR